MTRTKKPVRRALAARFDMLESRVSLTTTSGTWPLVGHGHPGNGAPSIVQLNPSASNVRK